MTDAVSESVARTLLAQARDAAEKAYAPYSHFQVGAALLSKQGDIFIGVNIENASYGLTLCAERVALAKAVSEGTRGFTAMAVWATSRPHGAVTPCGACRQFMAEFISPTGHVIMSDAETGVPVIFTMAALLPAAFDLPVVPSTGNNTLGDVPRVE